MAVHIHRLELADPKSWAYFPLFEQRALAFIEREKVDADPAHFRNDIRQKFLHPQIDVRRLLLFFDDEGQPFGHFYAWIDSAWGRNYVHVNQLDVDEGHSAVPFRDALFEEMDLWIERVNRPIPEGHPSRIDEVSFWTWHNPDVFARLLRSGCDLKISRYVLTYSQKERQARKHREALH
jgi:hypothetical protein